MDPVASLDARIRERHLLKHPFYVAWSKGELTLDTLRHYAGQYYQFEANFPRYVAAAYARLRNPADRRVLLENLVDEEGRSPTHPELWLDFAKGIGAKASKVRSATPTAGTRALLDAYESQAVAGSAASALGALYAYESIFPEVAAEKSRGLRAFYGINDAATHEFFRVHTEADVGHSAAERRILRNVLKGSSPSVRAARRGVEASLDGWWAFLDGFCGAARA
ncbi:MAG: CADD family putative folate metabolism protein [Thermoplasmata archaeon]|nr:CADD family putative folate metabolism protein [Thermoplasmata archaeon]